DISLSPFTLVFQNAGLLSAAAVMNAVILTAVLSAGNSGMYASTRMLFTLAQESKAPQIFARLSKNGVPRNAL
ncbi:MAG: amino acid permease, partial [Candidatus Regiella insecticola]|nr:amino acid permease [Candidatus Regiella insecticola]